MYAALSILLGVLIMSQNTQNQSEPGKWVRHYELLQHTAQYVVVKVNVAAYEASVVLDAYPAGEIAFNTNYFYRGVNPFYKNVPIGHLKQGDEVFKTVGSKGKRPILKIGRVECEVAPILVKDGKAYIQEGIAESKLRADATRQAQRVACGYNRFGKLIIVYGANATLSGLAYKLLEHGVVEGYAMDGGDSAYLKVGSLVRGKPRPIVAVSLARPK